LLLDVWEWVKEKLTTVDIYKLLTSTGSTGCNTLPVAATGGKIEPFQKVWGWAKKKLTTEEINNKLLLATDNMERSSGMWH
jgi:hypothetical protein